MDLPACRVDVGLCTCQSTLVIILFSTVLSLPRVYWYCRWQMADGFLTGHIQRTSLCVIHRYLICIRVGIVLTASLAKAPTQRPLWLIIREFHSALYRLVVYIYIRRPSICASSLRKPVEVLLHPTYIYLLALSLVCSRIALTHACSTQPGIDSRRHAWHWPNGSCWY